MNNLYNKECCSCCFGCRVYFLDDNWNNLYNQESCPRCFSCRVYFLDDNFNNRYNMRVVLVVLVVVFIFGDDNSNNEDNFLGRTSCRGTKIIAHLSENVNLVVINLDKRRRANRSEKALRRAKNANRRHTLGERISCLGERKSCRPNSGARSACPAAGRRGRLAGVS